MEQIELNIIHNPADTQRMELLCEQLDSQTGVDLSIRFWPAIEGNIAQAHKNIILWAKQTNQQKILIGENDLFFYKSDALKYYLDNEPEDYDLYLGGLYSHYDTLKVQGNIATVRMFSGLHLAITSERFYDNFLKADCSCEAIDIAISRYVDKCGAKIKVCYPYACAQAELPSGNIKGQVYRHRNYFTEESLYGYVKPQKSTQNGL